MTHSEWLAVCADMARLWPHAPLPPEAAEAWYPLLADLDADAVAAAVRDYAMAGDHRFPPSVGAIREHAQPPARDWHEALADLRALAARNPATGGKPEIADPALDVVADSYGWCGLCSIDLTNSADRAQFRDAYRDAQRRVRQLERFALAQGSPPAIEVGDGR